MNNSGKTLGILGGLGPMSSVYFYEMLTEHTLAERDSDHLNILLSSRADTPDRTEFITGRSDRNPIYTMMSEVSKLIGAGADIIAIPCNTAHYFYDRVASRVSVPIINIIDQTVSFCSQKGFRRVGVLATEGTALSGAYRSAFAAAGIEYFTCGAEEQSIINDIIYGKIKKNIIPSREDFDKAAASLIDKDCEAIILGCTELSLLKKEFGLGEPFVDSLEVLAASAIRLCGKEICGFDSALMKFSPERNVKYVIE